jgi:hypothetical protein
MRHADASHEQADERKAGTRQQRAGNFIDQAHYFPL